MNVSGSEDIKKIEDFIRYKESLSVIMKFVGLNINLYSDDDLTTIAYASLKNILGDELFEYYLNKNNIEKN